MKKKYFTQICSLVLLLLFFASCTGQTKTKPAVEVANSSADQQPTIKLAAGEDHHAMFRCSMKDKAGNLWFGTTGAGIYFYNGKTFTNFNKKDGLNNTTVYSICEDAAGNIFAATANGVFYKTGKTFSRLLIPGIDDTPAPVLSGLISKDPSPAKLEVQYIMSDKKGAVWFGTMGYGLWRYDRKTFTNFQPINNVWKQIPTDSVSYYKSNTGLIQSIMEDTKGNIWMSTVKYGGLFCYDGQTFKNIVTPNISNSHFFYMLQDNNNNIWCASRDDGICRYDGKTFTCFTQKDSTYFDRGGNCILQDKNGMMWFGSIGNISSSGGAVSVYDARLPDGQGNKFNKLATATLRNDRVWTMVEDNLGNIWLGTKEMGLFRYNGKTFTDFSEPDLIF